MDYKNELFTISSDENINAEIMRCLTFLYSTYQGQVPVNRSFGINYSLLLDGPIEVAKNVLAMEIIEKTDIYEPRVEVQSIEFETDMIKGCLSPVIKVRIKEGFDE